MNTKTIDGTVYVSVPELDTTCKGCAGDTRLGLCTDLADGCSERGIIWMRKEDAVEGTKLKRITYRRKWTHEDKVRAEWTTGEGPCGRTVQFLIVDETGLTASRPYLTIIQYCEDHPQPDRFIVWADTIDGPVGMYPL